MSRFDTRTRGRSLQAISAGIALTTLAAAVAIPVSIFAGEESRSAHATVDVGPSCAPGVQFLGFSDALDKTAFGGFAVAELSGLTHDESTGTYVAVADRAGAVLTHKFDLTIPLEGGTLGTPAVAGATVLTGPGGGVLNGTNFDAEGVVISKNGELIVASESGSAAGQQPEVALFEQDGAYIADLFVPAKFQIGANNGSFESLAMSPNGHSLFTAMELPLPVDGRTADVRSRLRIVRWDDRGPDGYEPVQEFFYLTEPGRTTTDVGVAELIALSETHLLVLERGFVAGQGNTIRIFQVSLEEAPEVSAVASLATLDAATHDAALASKTLMVDVAGCPASGTTNPPDDPANPLLENFEAMTLGPKIGGGWRSLILLSDDNLAANQTTRVVALAVRQSMVDEDGLSEPAQ